MFIILLISEIKHNICYCGAIFNRKPLISLHSNAFSDTEGNQKFLFLFERRGLLHNIMGLLHNIIKKNMLIC